MTDQFDAREWNMRVQLVCHVDEFDSLTKTEYTANLLTAAFLAKATAEKYPEHFKVNYVTRKRLSNWVKQFAQYQEFVDGCWLLMRYYDTGNPQSADDWTLVELHKRWSNLVSLSMYYGNAHQISNFVPFANKIVSDIVAETLRRKAKCVNKSKHLRPVNWRLDKDQVKADINMVMVFEHYFPDMKKIGDSYRAFCRWHPDSAGRNPNLSINVEKGMCHCKRCNAGFDVFGMIMDLENVDFATALARAYELGR